MFSFFRTFFFCLQYKSTGDLIFLTYTWQKHFVYMCTAQAVSNIVWQQYFEKKNDQSSHHIQKKRNVSLSFSFFNNTPRTQKCSCIEQWASRTTTSRVSFANWLSSYLRFYTRRLSRSKLQSNLKKLISKISLTIHSPISHNKWYSSERYYSLQSMNSLFQFILSWQFLIVPFFYFIF